MREPVRWREGAFEATGMAEDAGDNDPVLAGLLAAGDDEQRDHEIEHLIATHALPVVDRILASSLRRTGEDVRGVLEDLRGDVVVRLLHRLQLLAEKRGRPIHRFADYAAVVAYHRFDDFLRAAHPARTALGNRLRYLLTSDPRYAFWPRPDGAIVAGLASWQRDQRRPAEPPASLPPRPGSTGLTGLGELVAIAFARADGPLELSALIGLVADAAGIAEPLLVPEAATPLASPEPSALAQLESRQYLQQLWREILELPVRQRVAVLLNLRDYQSDSVVRLLPLTGIATQEEIAAAVEIGRDEFARLWEQLPLPDDRLAEILGSTRQQVINLRKSARERLARRMARFV
jgi:hypothetical protein